MRALILVAGAALALSACTGTVRLSTAQKIDLGCELAVTAATATNDVAHVAQQFGADPIRAQKIADAANHGEDVTRAICTLATAVAPQF